MQKTDYLKLYLSKIQKSQHHYLVMEQMDLKVCNKSIQIYVSKNNMNELINHPESQRHYLDYEWYYELPINHKFCFMTSNEAEYYRDIYIYKSYIYFHYYYHNENGNIYPSSVKFDYFTISLNQIYSSKAIYDLYKLKKVYSYPDKWVKAYNPNYPCNNSNVRKPEQMYEYFKRLEKDYNDQVKDKLWKWKLMDDKKTKFKMIMKATRKQRKLNTYTWQHIYTYLF